MGTKVCPKCDSENIELKPKTIEASQGFPQTHKCQECGFESIAFPEK
jgi:transposase-like protein